MLALWQCLALAAIPTVSAFPSGSSQKAFDWDSTKYLLVFPWAKCIHYF